MLKGFWAYSGFGEPEFIAETLEGAKENLVIRESYLTDSVDVTDKFLNYLEEEIQWIKKIRKVDTVDLSNEKVVEDLNSFFFEYGVWINPTKEEFQEFNRSKNLDENMYIEELFDVECSEVA